MTRRDLVITIIAATLALLIVVLLISALAAPSARPPGGRAEETPRAVAPAAAPPVSVTPGLTTWTGALTLTEGDALFATGGRSYPLFINAVGQSSKVLRERGFRSGERINVLGKVTATYIEVSGIGR